MKIGNYLQEIRAELKHVAWPTRRQTTNFTVLVIGISIFVAAMLGLLDLGFAYGLEQILQ